MRVLTHKDRRQKLLVARALASEIRLAILELLLNGPLTLTQIRAQLDDTSPYRATFYRHLEKLKDAGLVEKFYDSQDKSLKYKLRDTQLTFEL